MEYRIPERFLNSLGFINYGHHGQLPWDQSDVENENWYPLPAHYTSVTDILAIDCEMVIVGPKALNVLGRVSIVNEYGYCIYDTFAKPKQTVTNYVTKYSGITAEDLVDAPTVETVKNEVAEIVNGKILIGHSTRQDLGTLGLLNHPRSQIRDTEKYFKYKLKLKLSPSIQKLVNVYCNATVQKAEHNSIEDAQAALKLYLMEREEWENVLQNIKELLICDHYPDLTQIKIEDSNSIKCMKIINKVLKCGHKQLEPCHKQDGFICKSVTEVNIKLPCGHNKGLLQCAGDIAKLKCTKKVQLPCGHPRCKFSCWYLCHHKSRKPIKCKVFGEEHKQCQQSMKCGHYCNFLCQNEEEHNRYKCKQPCRKICTHGIPCPGDHECFKTCPFISNEILTRFLCGHGVWVAQCCNRDKQKNCPKCTALF